MNIELPPRLRSKLLESAEFQREASIVLAALGEYGDWLLHSRASMPFFPEYTDHGPRHLQALLDLVEVLVPDASGGTPDSWAQLTSPDAAIVILATLLHDAGMYLNEEGFLALLESTAIAIPELDQLRWAELWDQFFSVARRWDDQQRRNVFGDALLQVSPARREIRRPPPAPAEWDDLDRRLVGEFVRLHHSRLAHELAVAGWPMRHGPSVTRSAAPLKIAPHDPYLADLAGLVARSHGMSLRATLPYLEAHYFSQIESSRVHAVYLMALLRIADYLHLHAHRAPTNQIALRPLASPISRREWDAHAAVHDIRIDSDNDPEAVVIDCAPDRMRDVSTYFKLQSWVVGLQSELDACWAALGEVYGRHPRFRNFWLRIRRVKTNLFAKTFQQALPFVPTEARLAAADADLLTLLVRPLYGDRPAIAIRELLQNAVDAVLERRDRARHIHPSAVDGGGSPIDSNVPNADVIIRLKVRDADTPQEGDGGPPSTWTLWLEVADRGVGMTPEIARRYFLVAGASFRRSDAWRSMHERSLSELHAENDTMSRVLRSGRFGIGVLASFLMGEEIQVQTRHVAASETDAIRFLVRLDTSDVQFDRCCHGVGTTIRVRLNESDKDRIRGWSYESGWYCLEDPYVVRIDQGGSVLEQDYTLPGPLEHLPVGWKRIAHPSFLDIQWTWRDAPGLTCNGIKVGDKTPSWAEDPRTRFTSDGKAPRAGLPLDVPNISVFDPDGRLPLDLTRERLQSPAFPFKPQLLESVIRDFLGYILVHGPARPFRGKEFAKFLRLKYPGYSLRGTRDRFWSPDDPSVTSLPWLTLHDGVTIPDPFLAQWAQITSVLIAVRHYKARWVPTLDCQTSQAIFGFDSASENGLEKRSWPLQQSQFFPSSSNPLSPLEVSGARALVSRSVVETIGQTASVVSVPMLEDVRVELETPSVILWQTGSGIPSNTVLHELIGRDSVQRRSEQMAYIIEWYLSPRQPRIEPSPVSELWRRSIGQPCIPFEMAERRKRLAAAFSELRDEVAFWEQFGVSSEAQEWGWRFRAR